MLVYTGIIFVMNKLKRIFGYGVLLYVVFNLILFAMSMIFQFETEINKLGGVCLAIIMSLIMRWIIVVKFKITTTQDVLVYSAGWTIVIFALLLVVTIANETTKVFFGNWIAYVIFAIMILFPLFNLDYKQVSKV